MTDVRTNDAGVEFLERLLERSERNPDRSRPASAAPQYDKLSTAQQVGRFHDLMVAAERFGAVEVQRGRRDRGHLIERVRVRDPDLLARHLGRPTAAATAQRAREELLPVAATGEPWVAGLLDEMTGRWASGEAAYRLTAAPDRSRQGVLHALGVHLAAGSSRTRRAHLLAPGDERHEGLRSPRLPARCRRWRPNRPAWRCGRRGLDAHRIGAVQPSCSPERGRSSSRAQTGVWSMVAPSRSPQFIRRCSRNCRSWSSRRPCPDDRELRELQSAGPRDRGR